MQAKIIRTFDPTFRVGLAEHLKAGIKHQTTPANGRNNREPRVFVRLSAPGPTTDPMTGGLYWKGQ